MHESLNARSLIVQAGHARCRMTKTLPLTCDACQDGLRGTQKLEKLYNGNRRDLLEGRTSVPLFLLLSCIDCKARPLVGTWIKTNGHEVRPLWCRRAMPDGLPVPF